MIKDLGLHLTESHELLQSSLEPDDLEAVKRVYMSAYVWDKYVPPPWNSAKTLTLAPEDRSVYV